MKKRMLLFLVFLPVWASAQYIKLNSGFTSSNVIDNKYNMDLKTKKGFSLKAGLDYWEHRFFYLSSEIGYMTNGTKTLYRTVDSPLTAGYIPLTLHNLHINTTFHGKLPLTENFTLFAGWGPKWDYQIKTTDEGHSLEYFKKKGVFGMKSEAGIFYDFSKIRIGAEYAHLTNFQKSDATDKLYTDLFSLTVGYKLK